MAMRRLPSKLNGWTVTLLALIVFGMIYGIIKHPSAFIIPVVVLGGIFLLYKYPPSFLRGAAPKSRQPQVKPSRATAAKVRGTRPRSKTMPFRVIEGGKDDDDLPRYH